MLELPDFPEFPEFPELPELPEVPESKLPRMGNFFLLNTAQGQSHSVNPFLFMLVCCPAKLVRSLLPTSRHVIAEGCHCIQETKVSREVDDVGGGIICIPRLPRHRMSSDSIHDGIK